MKKLISIISVAFVATLFAVSSVSAAEKREVTQKVGKPLQEAQAFISKKQFEEALKKVEEARAVPEKTPFEEFKINEFAANVLVNLRKENEAAAIYEKLSESSFVSPEQSEMYAKGVITLYARTNNANKLLELLPKWIKTHPNDTDMMFTLALAQAKAGQQKAAKDTLEDLVRNAEKAGQKPKSEWLMNLANLSYKMAGNKWDKNALAVVEKTLHYYPNATLWQQMLGGMKEQQLTDGVKFQLYRLMLAVGALKSGEDYTELAQLANSVGLPAEGVNVLNAGFAAKVLGEGDSKERDNRKLTWMKGLMDKDKAELPADEQKAKAAADGNGDVLIGEDYIGYGQYAQAIEAIERGLKKGGIKKPDAAQMALGIAYYNNKQKDQARAAFKAVPANSELKSIADLWILHIG
ncbi:MAG TPA: tetratricopeptide repeat protein [Steroidobacteraceae bacterium]|nr:tetratricopeptide repeat protein [Steroidobacteraceae bacterium]